MLYVASTEYDRLQNTLSRDEYVWKREQAEFGFV